MRQNAHTFAANRKGVFVMVAPAGKGRTRDWAPGKYACRDKVEDTFLEDESEGDGRTPRSGDRGTIDGRTFIRMMSVITTMEIVNRISEYSADKRINPRYKPRNLSKRTPASLLESPSNIEAIQGSGWKRMAGVTEDNRLIFKMFDVGPPKDIRGS